MANLIDQYVTPEEEPRWLAERVDGVTRIVPARETAGSNLLEKQLAKPDKVSLADQITGLLSSVAEAGKQLTDFDQKFTADVLSGARNLLTNPTPEFQQAGKRAWRRLTGQMPGEERYQTWPEKMVRSGVTLPRDVMTGTEPILVMDPVTGNVMISPRVVERSMDTSGLMFGGSAFTAPRGSATLTTGPRRPGMTQEFKTVVDEYKARGYDVIGAQEPSDQIYRRNFAIQPSPANPNAVNVLKPDGTLLYENVPPQFADNVVNVRPDRIIYLRGRGASKNQWFPESIDTGMMNELPVYRMNRVEGKTQLVREAPDGVEELVGVYRNAGEAKKAINEQRPNDLARAFQLMSDTGTPGSGIAGLAASQRAPVFYSALENAVNVGKIKAGSGEQWLNTLRNQPGVKAEEMQWTGLEDFLKGKKKVTQQEVNDFLKQNKVEIKEVEKTTALEGEAYLNHDNYHHRDVDNAFDYGMNAMEEIWLELPKRDRDAWEKRAKDEGGEEIGFDVWLEKDENAANRLDEIMTDWLLENAEPIGGASDIKYADYQLPGGENYREILLTLPNRSEEGISKWYKLAFDGDFYKLSSADQAKAERMYEADTMRKRGSDVYRSSHWDEPNVLAHVRVNDRVMPTNAHDPRFEEIGQRIERKGIDSITPEEREYFNQVAELGGNKPAKSLHIEEIQSDWHQAGRKRGYKTAKPEEINAAQNKMNDARAALQDHLQKMGLSGDEIQLALAQAREGKIPSWVLGDPKHEHLATDFIDAQQAFHDVNKTSGVPDAPFKTSWPELALKRMIRDAAEKGYDRISWTPGEAQAARYDLSKHISKVQYHADVQRLAAFDKSGNLVIDKNIPPEKVPDFIGKDAADKLLNSEPAHIGKIHELRDADLKVGGEGMKGFYDKMLPKMIEKLGKPWGVKVKKGKIGEGSEDSVTWQGAEPTLQILEERFASMRGLTSNQYDMLGHVIGLMRRGATLNEAMQQGGGPTLVEALGGKVVQSPKSQPIWYIDLPQSMKDAALQKGFPLFMSGIPFPLTPVEGNPFERKEK